MDNQPIDVNYIVQRPIRPALGGIALGYPSTYSKYGLPLLAGKPKIALTMFESSKIPPDWVPILNTFDAITTPSTFCQKVFLECGIRVPIYKIPLGVSEIYKPRKPKEKPEVVFLAFLDRGKRKGGLAALQSFIRAFGDDPKYKLILKGRASSHPAGILNKNIEVIQEDYNEQQLYELYCSCDVLINPHYGEGFGLIPREFAATGGISLTTAWSGTEDDLRTWGWGIPYELVPADWRGVRRLEKLDLGYWAKPNLEGLVELLREVATFIDSYKLEAMRRAISVYKMFSWERFGREVLAVWRQHHGYLSAA